MDPTVSQLRLSEDMLPRLSSLFQKGVRVEIETGCTLESLLYDQWGLSPEYVMQKVSTLFLNGKPVDDLSTARVAERAVLALSSAMPGLVGAVMRRDGFFSTLREGITYRENETSDCSRIGLITVKLFNLLIDEIGPLFFSRGFWVLREDLPDDLAERAGKQQADSEDIFIVNDLN